MKKSFHEKAFDEYLYWQQHDNKIFKKINSLIKSIERDGSMQGEGKPEKLRHHTGQYSRRIDSTNRLVYEVTDTAITVISCKGHYDD